MVAEVCSFCGKRADEVRALVPGPLAVFICDVCVSLCEEINGKESARPQERANEAQVTEAELKERVRLRAAVAEFLKRYPQPELVLACSFGGKAKDEFLGNAHAVLLRRARGAREVTEPRRHDA